MKYNILHESDALIAFNDFSAGRTISIVHKVEEVGEGLNICNSLSFDTLHADLVTAFKNASGKAASAKFEAEAAPIFHAALSEITAHLSTDRRFWWWLQFAEGNARFANIVKNRFEKGYAAPNYGFGNLPESLFFRLWWRGFKLQEDDYNLARRGDVDLWRSHIIRIESPMPDLMLKALIKKTNASPGQIETIIPKEVANLKLKVPAKTKEGERDFIGQDFIRILAKKITARHRSCSYETMDEHECSQIIESLYTETIDELSAR